MKRNEDLKKGPAGKSKTTTAGNKNTKGGDSQVETAFDRNEPADAMVKAAQTPSRSPTPGGSGEGIQAAREPIPSTRSAVTETPVRKGADRLSSGTTRTEALSTIPATKQRSPGKPSGSPRHPTHDEIRRRAHEIYVNRGGAPGDATSDWYQAERELLAEMAAYSSR